jgi:GMP synthase (glutamine-hydrolysing)
MGEVTPERLDLLRRADAIVEDAIRSGGYYDRVWMAFPILTGVQSTGVKGDQRAYGEVIALRSLDSTDAMTADWTRLPYEVLARISNRLTNELPEAVRVVYDITTKPPATMEWE